MPSAEYMRQYRKDHPEYTKRENENLKEKLKNRYMNDPEYRERKKKVASEYYHSHKKV